MFQMANFFFSAAANVELLRFLDHTQLDTLKTSWTPLDE